MIGYGIFLWHGALVALMLILWRLSARLGRAMSDDVRSLALYPVTAGIIAMAGIFSALAPMWQEAIWAAIALQVLGAFTGWYASWRSWGWLVTELRNSRGER